MKKYLISSVMLAIIAFIAGVMYVGVPKVFGSLVRDRGSSVANTYDNKILLDATTTAGNPSRHATSTAIQIGGAKKVIFEFSVNATSSVAKATDFLIYVSPTADTLDGQSSAAKHYLDYQRFRELVNTTRSAPTTGDAYFTRVESSTVNDGATTTRAMDLSFGIWRSAFCVASTSGHAESNCKVLTEF